MALPDLTGQNIQDTYKRVLTVGDDGQVFDGTGSLVPTLKMTASHAITETSYETSSSYAETSSYANHLFGRPNLSVAQITASGDISSSGDLIASSSLTFGAPTSIIGKAGSNEYFSLSENQISTYINGAAAVTVQDTPNEGAIALNASNKNIDIKITHDDGVNAFHSDASHNTVALRDYISIGEGAPTSTINSFTVSGSSKFYGDITASGNISASGDLLGERGYFSNANGIYSDKVRRFSDSSTTTQIKLNDEHIKIFAGSSTANALGIQNQAVKVSGSLYVESPTSGHITASGNISASGDIYAGDKIFTNNQRSLYNAQGALHIGDEVGAVKFNVPVTASGNISSSGTIYGDKIIGPEPADGLIIQATNGVQVATGATPFYSPVPSTFSVWGDISSNSHITASGTISASGGFVGDIAGSATSATTATNVTAVAANTTAGTHYPTFVDGATGTQGIETDTGLTYVPSSGTLTATRFNGQASFAAALTAGAHWLVEGPEGEVELTVTITEEGYLQFTDGSSTWAIRAG